MSKTTKKLGKPTLHSTSSLTAISRPSENQLKTERYLNLVAQHLFKGRHYFKLGEREKIFLHEVLNGVTMDKHGRELTGHTSAQAKLLKAGLMKEVKA